MGKLRQLHQEYLDLKWDLFKGESFVDQDSMDKTKLARHNQLRALFNPKFRCASWVNPLTQNL